MELVVGAWNQFWPESFYTDFPTVELTPPFAEHYARDFGGATLGIGIVLAAAAIVPRTVLVVPALLAVSAFGIPHFVFHLHHLEHATPCERPSSSAVRGSPHGCRPCSSSSPCYE